MPARRRKSREKKTPTAHRAARSDAPAGETLTVAWTVSVTAVVLADLIVVAAHLLARSNPDAAALRPLAGILLLSAASMGAISLILLPIVWQRRSVKPPAGYVAFATFASAAPIIWTITAILK